MPGGAARGAQARTGSRAPSAIFSLTPGTNSGYTLGAASTFGLGASFTFALDPVRSLIFASRAHDQFAVAASTSDAP